jgi:hypothetical protein
MIGSASLVPLRRMLRMTMDFGDWGHSTTSNQKTLAARYASDVQKLPPSAPRWALEPLAAILAGAACQGELGIGRGSCVRNGRADRRPLRRMPSGFDLEQARLLVVEAGLRRRPLQRAVPLCRVRSPGHFKDLREALRGIGRDLDGTTPRPPRFIFRVGPADGELLKFPESNDATKRLESGSADITMSRKSR